MDSHIEIQLFGEVPPLGGRIPWRLPKICGHASLQTPAVCGPVGRIEVVVVDIEDARQCIAAGGELGFRDRLILRGRVDAQDVFADEAGVEAGCQLRLERVFQGRYIAERGFTNSPPLP